MGSSSGPRQVRPHLGRLLPTELRGPGLQELAQTPLVPDGVRPHFGADWGFAVDPTVLVRCWHWDRTLYIDAEAYKVGCEIDYTPALFGGTDKQTPARWQNPFGWSGVEGATEWPITADGARPETISYMQARGFRITAARKAPVR